MSRFNEVVLATRRIGGAKPLRFGTRILFFAVMIVTLTGVIHAGDALAITKDVGGADDWTNPNQQDLSQMGFDNSLANDPTEPVIDVFWSQDNISFPGSGNTASSAALIDGDGDGNVDYALFVTVGEDSSDSVTVDDGLITLSDSTQNGVWSFITIINGQADINSDGVIDGNDDTLSDPSDPLSVAINPTLGIKNIVDGYVDFDGDGIVPETDGGDDGILVNDRTILEILLYDYRDGAQLKNSGASDGSEGLIIGWVKPSNGAFDLADYNGVADIVSESVLDGFATLDGITFKVNSNGYYDPNGDGVSDSPHPFASSLTEISISLVADPFLGEAKPDTGTLHENESKSVAPDPYWDVGFFATIDTRDLVQIESGPPPSVPLGQNPLLVNVCSYPSASPSSDAKDCIVSAGSGFINTITKTISESPSSDITFSWTWGTELPDPTELTFLAGTTELTQSTDAIPLTPGSNFLIETVPSGWQLDAAWASDGTVILIPVINGFLDMNGDGSIDGADDGFVNDADATPNVYEVIDGYVDVDGDRNTGGVPDVDDDDPTFRGYVDDNGTPLDTSDDVFIPYR